MNASMPGELPSRSESEPIPAPGTGERKSPRQSSLLGSPLLSLAALQNKVREFEPALELPEWPENSRGVPNLCLRSALFGVIRRGRRRAVKGAQICTVKGLSVRYTGWRLDQGDFDVLVQALHLQARCPGDAAGKHLRFEVKSFLRSIGRQPGKSGREWLKDSFRRLTATAVEIKIDIPNQYISESFTYAGSLVEEFIYNEREQTYFLKINPRLANLFDAGWTGLQWQQRLQLKTNLAKWLHGFYASHREPFPIKVATLKLLCGSESGRLVDYRRNLRLAMSELVRVGAIEFWKIDQEDKIHVRKNTPRPLSGESGAGA